ncbi:hypothetical protein CYY_005393 [Polysphondylium violaceum]|uniref:EngB-type G domain-containing protein n=1 Tax=Polysphondylium violaceum TaxID=133409 RepID=A0A8J4PV48_9MYCE|nr:hypothetical protein CYY_005393 [Polysphondylium violaceum]
MTLNEISSINKSNSLPKSGPKQIGRVKIPKDDINAPIFTDENSSIEDKQFEEQLKKLMVLQGKDNISQISIPAELIESAVNSQKEATDEEVRFAQNFFNRGASLERMAIKSHDFPKKPYPQIALLGRSNVGKSSLLNALLSQPLANTSKHPGCTKAVNFYQVWEKLFLIDLPGYGYARVSKERSSVWSQTISEYLLTSAQLVKVFLLIDSRVGVQKNDKEVMKLLDEHRVSFQIVLTKIDKTKPGILKKIYNTLKEEIADLVCCLPYIIQTSTLENKGIDELRTTILKITGFDKQTYIDRKASLPKEPIPENKKKLKREAKYNKDKKENNNQEQEDEEDEEEEEEEIKEEISLNK